MDFNIRNPNLFLHRINFRQQNLEFADIVRSKISEPTFLDEKTLGSLLLTKKLPLKDFIEGLDEKETEFPPAQNFIFHTGFCCSTLITRALDSPGQVLSLKEPNVFLNLSQYKRAPAFATYKTFSYKNLEQATLGLLNKPFEGNEKILIKPSNIANNTIHDLLRNNSQSKAVLLFQSQKEFLISLLKKGEPGRLFARKVFMTLSLDDNNRQTEFYRNPMELTDLQVMGFLWGVQMQNFYRVYKAFPDQVKLLDCKGFLLHPEKTLEEIGHFFKFNYPENHFKDITNSPGFNRNSKFQNLSYSPEARNQENQKVEEENRHSLEYIQQWSEPYLRMAHLSEISAF